MIKVTTSAKAWLLPALCLSFGCAIEQTQLAFCESEQFLIDQAFDGGQFARCDAQSPARFNIEIEPEDAPPINPSPWYSLRISPLTPGNVTLDIRYQHAAARYWPKLSFDGRNWQSAEAEAVTSDGDMQTVHVEVPATGLWVSAQELLVAPYFEAWWRELAAHDALTVTAIGSSLEGRALMAASSETDSRELVVLLGRQHPPEVSGTLAMRIFVQTVLGDSDLAQRFRARFSLFVVPLVNPDGVSHGHWRHNLGGIDLNRDWGPFTQPETKAVFAQISTRLDAGYTLASMLDFHSTRRDLFYTQQPAESGESPDFAMRWLGAARKRLPTDYEFEHDARPTSEQPNTKNFFFTTYGIPAITYELGDETDRAVIEQVTPIFAQTFMETLLATPQIAGAE